MQIKLQRDYKKLKRDQSLDSFELFVLADYFFRAHHGFPYGYAGVLSVGGFFRIDDRSVGKFGLNERKFTVIGGNNKLEHINHGPVVMFVQLAAEIFVIVCRIHFVLKCIKDQCHCRLFSNFTSKPA